MSSFSKFQRLRVSDRSSIPTLLPDNPPTGSRHFKIDIKSSNRTDGSSSRSSADSDAANKAASRSRRRRRRSVVERRRKRSNCQNSVKPTSPSSTHTFLDGVHSLRLALIPGSESGTLPAATSRDPPVISTRFREGCPSAKEPAGLKSNPSVSHLLTSLRAQGS